MADVSILVVNWNTRDRLRRCLEALARLPAPVSCDVVVVDNGSTDGSAEMVASGFPSVRFLQNARNEGFARAVNRGVAETDAPFVLLLNSDAELQSGALATLAGTLRDHPDVAAAGAQLFKPDGRIQHAFDVFPSLLTELVNKGLLRRLWPSRHPSRLQARSESCEVDSLIGACMMIRRAAIEDVGGLDPRFFVFYEETDWCLRARRDGWRIVLVPGARAVHGQGETKAHHPGRARVESWRSKYAYFDKHRGRRVRAFLQAVSFARLSVQVAALAVGVALTLGLRASWRRKLVADAWLWAWHAAGAPSGFGFAPSGQVPGYVRRRMSMAPGRRGALDTRDPVVPDPRVPRLRRRATPEGGAFQAALQGHPGPGRPPRRLVRQGIQAKRLGRPDKIGPPRLESMARAEPDDGGGSTWRPRLPAGDGGRLGDGPSGGGGDTRLRAA